MILIVDDDEAIRKLFDVLLTDEGYRVVLAEDGAQVWRLLARSPCRLVISDYAMPEYSGVEVIAAIRRQYPGVRTVLMSGHPELPALAQQAGADRYYCKGDPLTELTASVRALLEDTGS